MVIPLKSLIIMLYIYIEWITKSSMHWRRHASLVPMFFKEWVRQHVVSTSFSRLLVWRSLGLLLMGKIQYLEHIKHNQHLRLLFFHYGLTRVQHSLYIKLWVEFMAKEAFDGHEACVVETKQVWNQNEGTHKATKKCTWESGEEVSGQIGIGNSLA